MTVRMLPEPKRLVLEALRSDEFSQTRGHLVDQDGHCCLGVMCEVAMRAGVDVSYTAPHYEWNGVPYGYYDGRYDALPSSVSEWLFGQGNINDDPEVEAEIDDDDGVPHIETCHLSILNDGHGLNFHQIADAIEASL